MASTVPSDSERAQAALLRDRKRALGQGAEHFGWKIGINDPRARRFYGLSESVVGYMTRESPIESSRQFAADSLLVIEPELAIRVAQAPNPEANEETLVMSIGHVAPALEVLNLDQPRRTLDEVMAHNIFHVGVCLGDWIEPERAMRSFVECRKNGEVTASARVPQALPPLFRIVKLVAHTLCHHGERLEPGDVIISGSMTPAIPLETGVELHASFSGLGRLQLERDDGGGLTFKASDD